MKKKYLILTISLLVMAGQHISAQLYQPVEEGSSVTFVIQNMGMGTSGTFRGLKGKIRFDPAMLKAATFSITIDAGSIDTDIDVRDSVLKTPEYLGAGQHPEISIMSKQILGNAKLNQFTLKGMLTLKGIQKEVAIPFVIASKKDGILFTGDFTIRRSDFNIGIGSLVLSENIKIFLSVFARKL